MFKILVKVKPNAKIQKVEKVEKQASLFTERGQGLDFYKVSVTAQAVDGKANKAVVEVLADYFAVASSCVVLISGATTPQKIFEIHI